VRLFSVDTKIQALGRAPLFEHLSKKELQELATVADDMEVEAGRVLVREGDTGREFFVLMDGEVSVERGGKDLGNLGAGDFIGEIAILEEIPRTATVTAASHLRFFVLTAQAFRSVVESYPDVGAKVMRALARRLYDLASEKAV
jgi:CRP-like cAMP-binding protein